MSAGSGPRLAIGLISAAVLAYEVLLMALLSLIQWHHFAYLVVSVALLGFGASGSLLVLTASRLVPVFRGFATLQGILFGLSIIVGFSLAQRFAFNPEELIWDRRQWLNLALVMLLLTLPFFFAANLIGISLIAFRRQLAKIYAADLVGAGLGAIAIIGIMYVLDPVQSLRLVAFIGPLAALALWLQCGGSRGQGFIGLVAAALLLWLLPGAWIQPEISPYKELSQTLRLPQARVVAQRFSPLGRLSVVESPALPLRHAPGLSLTATVEPPPQLALFTDGGAMTAINRFDGNRASLAYLDAMTSALPYHLLTAPKVLIIGAGGGTDIQQAFYHHSARIDAVEINPQIVELMRGELAAYSGGVYALPNLQVHIAEARGFLQRGEETFDLIQIPLLDSAGGAGGVHGLNENYIYTVEALAQATRRLQPGGMLALTRWIRIPPRDSLKLFATAIAALERAEGSMPARQLVLIRGLQTSTLLVKNGQFSAPEIERIKSFSAERAFDLAYYPGIAASETNRTNRLDAAYFHAGATALLGPAAQRFSDEYKFNLEPATDNRPFHFHFVKWRTLLELLDLRLRGGSGLIETGYLTLLLSLALGVTLSLVLIIAPLLFIGKKTTIAAPGFSRWRVFAYFAALGLGFLLIEISFLQKFILLLQHPLYAAAVVLSAFLISAGAGSALAQRYAGTLRARRATAWAVLLILLCSGVYLAMLDTIIEIASAWPLVARAGLSALLILPLGFAMGMPFPLGLASLEIGPSSLVPWAWGINGCASVISAVLATLLAIHFGFDFVIATAMACYALALLAYPRFGGDAAVTRA